MGGDTSNDSADRAFEALFELFSDKRLSSRRHMRCPIDHPPTDFDEIWDSVLDDLCGRDVEYDIWVDDLRQNGLIAW